jgi:hypothetical protein
VRRLARAEPGGGCCQFGWWTDIGQTSTNAMPRRRAAALALLAERSYRPIWAGMDKIVEITPATPCSIRGASTCPNLRPEGVLA